jgi:hypothetical protein
LPVDVLVGALQDVVHVERGGGRLIRATRIEPRFRAPEILAAQARITRSKP